VTEDPEIGIALVLQPGQFLSGAIGGAVVDDDHFRGQAALRFARVDRFADVRSGIITGYDYGNQNPWHVDHAPN
jgi:hypothetical protein